MMSLLNNLFGRRSRGFGRFGRRHRGMAHNLGGRRGGMELGTIAAIAAPFIMRKMRSRHMQRAQGAAYWPHPVATPRAVRSGA
jgi:hypothetical protein